MRSALHRLDVDLFPQASRLYCLRRLCFARLHLSTVRTWNSHSGLGFVPDVDSQRSIFPAGDSKISGRKGCQINEESSRLKQPPCSFSTARKEILPSIRFEGFWISFVREISSNGRNFLPRKAERYSGRELDRSAFSERHTKFDENFKRLPVVKKPISEYKQATVERSTRNIPLVPKRWKRAIPSKEAVDAVMYLRRAKLNKDAVREVMRKRIARLLRLELMMVLSELQRIDECYLARQVFNAIRNEPWYKPDIYLYQTMVDMFGRNGHMEEAIEMFEELRDEGLQPDGSIQRTLLKSYVGHGMIPEAIELYKKIQNVELDRAARSMLFHGLNTEEKLQIADYEKSKGYDWS